MRTLIEPPLSDWSVSGCAAPNRSQLTDRINCRAQTLGTAPLADPGRIIATGHQAWLWHPGILAKNIAAAAAAARLAAAPLHLVVDSDAHEALSISVPQQRGDRLTIRTLRLAPHDAGVPTGFQSPVDAGVIRQSLRDAGIPGRNRLLDAVVELPPCRTLAEQIAVVLVRLMRPWVDVLPVMMASDLAELPAFGALLDQMLSDARDCASAYNAAVNPASGVAALRRTDARTELPLWAIAWGRLRRPVYADRSGSRFVFADGAPIDRGGWTLLPRALLLTAFMRCFACDLFIHGTGGAAYDRVTERWWRSWRGEALGPMAVVTADLRLDFSVPVADRDQVSRAKWYRHHLPHNLDRVLGLTDGSSLRKRDLIEHMNDDRDRQRRAAAFAQIHRINDELARASVGAVTGADKELTEARIGLANAAVAHKRDWPFYLYPDQKLRTLRQTIAGEDPV